MPAGACAGFFSPNLLSQLELAMRHSFSTLRAATLACALFCISVGATGQNGDRTVDPVAASQQAAEMARGDPARWYREDATSAARLRTAQKEMGAALREAQNACRQGPQAERADCLKAARATWQHDMAAARAQREATAAN
jgi:hypothetical protein